MAALKRNAVPRTSKATDGDGTGTGTSDAHAHAHDYSHASSSSLARAMREFKDLVQSFEAGLRRSLEDSSLDCPVSSQHIRREACRLAIADFSSRYTRKDIRDSLDAAEYEGKRLEEQLQQLSLTSGGPTSTSDQEDEDEEDKDLDHDHNHNNLGGLHHGHFRLYSTELFELLGQPTDLRFGLLRFHKHPTHAIPLPGDSAGVTIELALNNSYFVADSEETLPYHTFRLPSGPSLQNRGILSRKPEDDGAFPAYDSWLLFTFLGNGCIKVEVPIEMCADVYGDRLRGREDEDVLFWGFFVDDDAE